jgi:hypothetical protein
MELEFGLIGLLLVGAASGWWLGWLIANMWEEELGRSHVQKSSELEREKPCSQRSSKTELNESQQARSDVKKVATHLGSDRRH